MSPSLGHLEFMDVLKKKMFVSVSVFHSTQFPFSILIRSYKLAKGYYYTVCYGCWGTF